MKSQPPERARATAAGAVIGKAPARKAAVAIAPTGGHLPANAIVSGPLERYAWAKSALPTRGEPNVTTCTSYSSYLAAASYAYSVARAAPRLWPVTRSFLTELNWPNAASIASNRRTCASSRICRYKVLKPSWTWPHANSPSCKVHVVERALRSL